MDIEGNLNLIKGEITRQIEHKKTNGCKSYNLNELEGEIGMMLNQHKYFSKIIDWLDESGFKIKCSPPRSHSFIKFGVSSKKILEQNGPEILEYLQLYSTNYQEAAKEINIIQPKNVKHNVGTVVSW